MSLTSPLVIALVSGKGGVGKTMLSVAVAKELAISNRTLIIDLDFFNRGLTGLLGRGDLACEIDKPGFLMEGQTEAPTKWRIIKVAENLFHIQYPDLLPEEMQSFETLDVDLLKLSLQAFICEAAEKCQCECVVLDCHGGPDNSSFAACLISDYSLLISEPDRITFYGTLNFLRQLKRIGGERDVNLHLVFNKVVPAFSGLFLRSLYNRLIKEHFEGRPLLAIFPLEVYLTKEFEKTPFLTAVYPDSWLAKKSRVLLKDLLSQEHKDNLSPPAKSMPGWMRTYIKLSLGKQLPIFNMNVVMSVIVTAVAFVALLQLSLVRFFPREPQRIRVQLTKTKILECLYGSKLLSDPEKVKQILASQTPDSDMREYIRDLQAQLDALEREDPRSKPKTKEEQEAQAEKERLYFKQWDDLFTLRRCVLEFDYRGSYHSWYSEPLLTERSEVLKNRRPLMIPPEYRNIYDQIMQDLENTNRIFRLLRTLSWTISSSYTSLAIAGTGWLGLVLLLNWSSQLDRRFTYYCRTRRIGSVLGPYMVAIVLWFFPLLIIPVLADKLIHENVPYSYWVLLTAAILLVGVLTSVIVGQTIRVYRDVKYEGHYLEDLLRAMFLAYLAGGPVAIYFLFTR